MNGFFQSSDISQKSTDSLIPKCGACGIYKLCKSPKMPVTGEGRKGILIMGEAPGGEEDERNEQFVGKSGQFLRSTLEKFDIDLDRDCWKTNALICRPPENRTPTSDEIEYCRPNLTSTINDLNPRIIIPMGGSAVRSLLGPLWREDTGPVSKWVGCKIPSQRYNSWICPTYHPSYVNRMEDSKEGPVVKLWFERHIDAAIKLSGRPWNVIPNFKNEVECILSSEYAKTRIEEIIESGKALAFDYETNRLKPDHPSAEIICCSISTGDKTFAYPWVGEAIKATGELLKSENPKIGANIKFEDRWTREEFGFPVNNWVWDCMLSAHHLDNRSGITGLKMQSFLRLGQEDWSHNIKPYLTTTDENGVNRIKEIDMGTLLVYCAIDSKVEYELAKLQRKEMKDE